MSEMNNEFDAFGPWIYEIDEYNGIPRLFSDYEYLKNKSLMMFKIPRQIDRRVANPDMHLYDMLVSVQKRDLIILSRDGDSFTHLKVAIPEIIAISRTEALLDGKIELFFKNDVISFEYNTTSAPIIVKFLNLIRGIQRKSIKRLVMDSLEYDLSLLDMPYFTLVERIRADDPEFELIAFQPSITNPENSKWMKRLKRMFADDSFSNDDVISSSSAFLCNRRELICISRNLMSDGEDNSNYAYTYSYIPVSNLKRSKIELFSKTPFLERFVINITSNDFSFIIDDNQVHIKELNKQLKTKK